MVFLFILKALGLGFLLTAITTSLTGKLLVWKKADHPHSIFPSWLILGLVGTFVGLIVSLIGSIYLVFQEDGESNLTLLLIIAVVCGEIAIITLRLFMRR